MNSHHILIHEIYTLVLSCRIHHLHLILLFNCSLGLDADVFQPVRHLITISPNVVEGDNHYGV